MIELNKFEFIRHKYGTIASWAIWAEEGETPKSNIGDLSVFDVAKNKVLLNTLNPNVILVGLNFAHVVEEKDAHPFHNFHNGGAHATDFKLRYGLRNTPLWGAYMTDIIKDFPERESDNVVSYLSKHKKLEETNVDRFREEISDLGTVNPTIVAIGGDSHSIVRRNFKDQYKILKIPHYAHFISKEDYREHVLSVATLPFITG